MRKGESFELFLALKTQPVFLLKCYAHRPPQEVRLDPVTATASLQRYTKPISGDGLHIISPF